MFIFQKNTEIVANNMTAPVQNAVRILERDRDKVLTQCVEGDNKIVLKYFDVMDEVNSGNECVGKLRGKIQALQEEQFYLEIEDTELIIYAEDDLGFIYGLLYLSEQYLGIKPFWFWMDQVIQTRECVEIAEGSYLSPRPVVRFRGWFYNDEVLMLKWKYNENGEDGWRMAFEALLRCGGNMAIPGTDKLSRENRRLASDMGLWITHHHAEPLGAEMFARAYPGVEANFKEHPEMFYKLWEDAVISQKDYKVVWNLCFRGQGDSPFWASDNSGEYDTPQKRGALISELIRKQCDIVKKYVDNPVFCTNLYGEIMELYKEGHIDIDEDVIKVRADNGYGKMVTRRRDNHSVRVAAMPDAKDKGAQGIYYHVSFYDLQAANHITMLPNSVAFVDNELSQVLENGGDDFWVINCSNVRPHTYYLDTVRKKWFGRNIDDVIQSKEFAEDYFDGDSGIAVCYAHFPEAMIPYGENDDEHMGEQYYTENARIMAYQFLVDRERGNKALHWIVGEGNLGEQVGKVCKLCENGVEKLEHFYEECLKEKERLEKAVQDNGSSVKSELFNTTLLLQTQIHYYCAKGLILFGKAFEAYEEQDYIRAFVLFGRSAELFDEADNVMRNAEYGVWENFYLNDCFADMKHSAYMIRKVMGIVRELGDNVRHDKWYRDFCYAEEDKGVFLQLVLDNHMTDEELYRVMKEQVVVE